MNIDFNLRAGFSAYVLLLMFSGAVMLVLAGPVGGNTSRGTRIANAVFGAGFLGYGFYLAFLFHGGTYFVFFKAFILPLLLILRTVRSKAAARRSAQTPTPAGQPPYPPVSYPPAQYRPPASYQPAHYQPPASYQPPTSYQPPAAQPPTYPVDPAT